ncbi:MAG: putative zinc-binding protein [bacterium]
MSDFQVDPYLCSPGSKLIFACSGGSDTGEIADRVARKLSKDGVGKMFCLAGIGGWINWIIISTDTALKVLVIDGCPLNCAKKTMEHSGFNNFEHICLADLGLQKGKSPVTEGTIEIIADKIKAMVTYLWNVPEECKDRESAGNIS